MLDTPPVERRPLIGMPIEYTARMQAAALEKAMPFAYRRPVGAKKRGIHTPTKLTVHTR